MSGERDPAPDHEPHSASVWAWASLPHEIASVLASTETPERRIDRALKLTTRAIVADRLALVEVSPVLAREITVVPAASREEAEALRARLVDLTRLLTEVPAYRDAEPGKDDTTIALPLVGSGGIVGMLHAERQDGGFDELHLRVLAGVAAQLASYLMIVSTQRELVSREQELRAIYEAGLVGVAFVDGAGGVTLANDAARRLVKEPAPGEAGRSGYDEALRVAEARFAGIIGIALDAIVVVDETQRIVLFNRGAERTFGYASHEVLGQPLDMLFPPRLRDVHRAHVDAFASSGTTARTMVGGTRELVGLGKTGEEFPIEAAISCSESGGQRLITVVLRDITERRAAEREQGLLTEAMSALGFTLDRDDTLASIAALAVRGVADCSIAYTIGEDGVPQRVHAAVADPSKVEIARTLERTMLGANGPYPGRSAIESEQPVVIWKVPAGLFETTTTSEEQLHALRDLNPKGMMALPLLARGHCVGGLVLFGATRRYGPADLRFAEKIAGRAGLSLDNAILYHTTREAVAARDEVLAVVAHDLRNPLNTIRLGASLIRDRECEPAILRRTLDGILRAARRAERLIEDLLDVHRISEGNLPLALEELSAGMLVADAVDGHSTLATAASIELRVQLPEATPRVIADRDRVLQVFENLIGNSLKFTPAGGSITVGLQDHGGEEQFSVADTGSGLAPEEVTHAFDRSWRRPQRERSGAGLGLSICRGIIEAHGGDIWVESAPGKGTTVSFTLPKARRSRRA